MGYLLSILVILSTAFLLGAVNLYKKERKKKKLIEKEKQFREERIKKLLLANPQMGDQEF